MKQTTKKKPKVFRTLVRLTHIGEKSAFRKSQASTVSDGKEKQPRQPPSFFGR